MPHQASHAHAAKGRRKQRGSKRNYRYKITGITYGSAAGVNTMFSAPSMPVFPPRITKWLRYATTGTIVSTSGVITQTVIFRANDALDPEFAVGGHGPMGFDQIMVWYNHFIVLKARIKILFKNDTASTSPTVCIRVDANSTPLTSVDQIMEFGGYTTESLEAKNGYGANKELAIGVDIPTIQGVPYPAILADVNLRGTTASSPTEVTYFHVTMWNSAGVTSSCFFDVVIEYQVVFQEPRNVTLSAPVEQKDTPTSVRMALRRPSTPLPGTLSRGVGV